MSLQDGRIGTRATHIQKQTEQHLIFRTITLKGSCIQGGMGTGNMMPMAQTFKIPTLTHEEILETEQFDQFVVTVSK